MWACAFEFVSWVVSVWDELGRTACARTRIGPRLANLVVG